jgi:hypothetical protein
MTNENNINKNNPNQFKPEPYIAKTYDVAYIDNLYPELNYQDASLQRGYGPVVNSPDESKYCSKCSVYKEVNANDAYCPTCRTAFGTVVRASSSYAKDLVREMQSTPGKQSVKYEKETTDPDGTYTKETVTYTKY